MTVAQAFAASRRPPRQRQAGKQVLDRAAKGHHAAARRAWYNVKSAVAGKTPTHKDEEQRRNCQLPANATPVRCVISTIGTIDNSTSQ